MAAEAATQKGDDYLINSFESTANDDTGIDYNKMIEKYECYTITLELIERVERAIGERNFRFLRSP